MNPFVANIAGILALIVTYLSWSGTKLPILSNEKLALLVVLILGLVMCASGSSPEVAKNMMGSPWSIIAAGLGIVAIIIAILAWLGLAQFLGGTKNAILIVGVIIVINWILTIINHR